MFRVLFAMGVSVWLFTATTYATVTIPVTDADLAQQADVIVVGTITALTSAWGETQHIVTQIQLSVDDVLKGYIRERHVTVIQAGGLVGDVQLRIDGTPEFTVGEKVLLFLTKTKDGGLTVLHMYQGKFSVFTDTDSGVEMTYRDMSPEGVHVLSDGRSMRAATEAANGFLPLADLKTRIQGALSRDVIASRPIVPLVPLKNEREESSFTLLGSPAVRWFEPDSGQPVTMKLNPSASPPGAPGALWAALMAWMGVSGSSFRFAYGGLTTAAGLRYDGENAISFGDPLGQMSPPFVSQEVNPLTGKPLCRGTLAIGGYFRSGSVTTIVNGQPYYKIIEGDLVFADGWEGCDNGVSNASHVAEIATHELGHVLGLGHSEDTDATMYAMAHFDGRGASLRADDSAGLQALYPAPVVCAHALSLTAITLRTLTMVESVCLWADARQQWMR